MTPQRSKNIYKLSPIQEGMLLEGPTAKNSKVDVEQIVCSIDEALDTEMLKSAWRLVVDRHEAMRTCFYSKDSQEPHQNIHRDVVLPWNIRDVRGVPEAQQEREFNQWLRADNDSGFELDSAPLMRLNLFRLGDKKWTMVWSFHRGILDSRSVLIALSEVFRTYDAQLRGEALELPAVRPFSDYIEFLYSLDSAQAEKYWRKTLRGVTGTTRLRALASKGSEDGYGEQEFQLSTPVTAALAELAVRERFHYKQRGAGRLALALGRYNDTDDVVFGTARPCRGFLPRAGSMVGKFGNTLPVRVQMESTLSIFELLRQIRTSEIGLRDFEHTSLARIQSWSDLRPRRRLFESVVVFDHAPLNSQMKSPYLNWDSRRVQVRENANGPVTLYVYAEPALTLRLVYDKRRFGQANVQQALLHLATILGEIATGTEKSVAEIQDAMRYNRRPASELQTEPAPVRLPAKQVAPELPAPAAPASIAPSVSEPMPSAAVAAVPALVTLAIVVPQAAVLSPVYPAPVSIARMTTAPCATPVPSGAPVRVAPALELRKPNAALAAVPATAALSVVASPTIFVAAPVHPVSCVPMRDLVAAPATHEAIVSKVEIAAETSTVDRDLWSFADGNITAASSVQPAEESVALKPSLVADRIAPSGPFAWATETPEEPKRPAVKKPRKQRMRPGDVLGNLLNSAKSAASTVSENCMAAPSALRELFTNDRSSGAAAENAGSPLNLRDSLGELRGHSSFVSIQPNGMKPPIFCISALDGELNVFRSLSAGLGSNQPVYALDASAVKNDPALQGSVKKIARYYIEQLRSAGQGQPYCLMGASFGGLVALEMSQQLNASGAEVAATVLINTYYPAGCRTIDKLNARVHRYSRPWRKALKRDSANSAEEFDENLYNDASAPVPTGEMAKAEQKAADKYRTRPYAGRACIFTATTPLPGFDGGSRAGWDRIFTDNLSIYYEIPSDRGLINTSKHAGLMVRRLNEFLGGVAEARVVPAFTRIAS